MKKYYDRYGMIEVHMIGNYVGVCWRIEKKMSYEEDTFADGTHRSITTTALERIGKPYIAFPNIRQDSRDDTFYIDEDSTISFGVNENNALEIAKELELASTYIKEKKYASQFNMAYMEKP